MKNMSCDIELGQNVDLSWMNSWINTENEGSLCFLSLPNTHYKRRSMIVNRLLKMRILFSGFFYRNLLGPPRVIT